MKMRLTFYAPLVAALLVPMSHLQAQETAEEPPARGERGSTRGMDPAERLKRMLEHFDADKDGVLTKDEFKGDQSRFKRMDANGDGKVDPKELEKMRLKSEE